MRTNLSISFDELLAAGFEIPRYDETFHYQKIQNLISRLRALSLNFVIHTRQGRIYSTVNWDNVSVLSLSAHQESLKKSPVLNLFLGPDQKNSSSSGNPEKTALKVSISKLKSALVENFPAKTLKKSLAFLAVPLADF